MKNINSISLNALLFIFSILFVENIKAQKKIGEPSFIDNGKTIDSLKLVHGTETVSYDKWDKKSGDSCLTVCLINSRKVPKGVEAAKNFIKIASAIKMVLKSPNTYNSIYIIFVKKETFNGMEIKTHTSGMDVLMSEL
jgi:hypothetical protein